MKRLLVADDEPGIRTLVKVTLEGDDYDILEAADGKDALDLVRGQRPALVLLDVMMPGMSGFDVCRSLKEDPATAGVPVVMLTAKNLESERREGLAAGADGYLTKPFSPIELLDTVDDILATGENA